jgi:hypothetical protein
LTTAKKIGLAAFIIAEMIICISAIIIFYHVIKGGSKVDDLATIIYAQTGILGIVWGSQSVVNYAKNKSKYTGSINNEDP